MPLWRRCCLHNEKYKSFLHNRPRKSPVIKSISSIHVVASQSLSHYCDLISNRLWRHQQNEDRPSETRGRCVKIVVLSSCMVSLCRVMNKIMCVLSWRTVSARTGALLATREINTKITLWWALKQIVTLTCIILNKLLTSVFSNYKNI